MSSSVNAEAQTISAQLERLLKERKITHAQLAERMGVSRPAVSRLLSPNYDGHTVASLNKIADALEVQLEVNFKPVVTRRPSNPAL